MRVLASAQERTDRERLGQRWGAVLALVLAPIVALILGHQAWVQCSALWDDGPRMALARPSSLTLSSFLTPVAAATGAIIAAYLVLSTVVAIIAPRQSRTHARAMALMPAGWRRLVSLAAAGTLSASFGLPALATVDVPHAGWVEPSAPATHTAHERPLLESSSPPPKPIPAPGITPTSIREEIIVAPGDTLWDLTAHVLGNKNSDPSSGGSAWPQLYAQNREVIGSDPDLILPGQRLALPAEWNQ